MRTETASEPFLIFLPRFKQLLTLNSAEAVTSKGWLAFTVRMDLLDILKDQLRWRTCAHQFSSSTTAAKVSSGKVYDGSVGSRVRRDASITEASVHEKRKLKKRINKSCTSLPCFIVITTLLGINADSRHWIMIIPRSARRLIYFNQWPPAQAVQYCTL
jgi:hypothetical protein